MKVEEVELKFEREGAEGIVPVGTYLVDAAKRLGIRFDNDCIPEADIHFCSVVITTGLGHISGETQTEREHFQKAGRRTNERLACQVKFEKPGEVIIMTKEKKADGAPPETAEDMSEQYRKEFTEMPLEKKIASLVQLETIAFGETVSFIINSPFKVADKLMDVMAEFGFKKEEEQKSASRPAEHKASPKGGRHKTSADIPVDSVKATGSDDARKANGGK